MKYLVQNHLDGSYYISSQEPKVIEAYCETCDDSDKILISWNSSEKNAQFNALLKFLMTNVLNTRDDIYNKAEENLAECYFWSVDIIYFLQNYITYNIMEKHDILIYLYDGNYITEDEYHKIMDIMLIEEKRQLKMLKYYEKAMFTKDEKTGETMLKLRKKNI